MKTRYRFYLPIAAATLILGIGGNSYAEREPQNCKCSGEWEKQAGMLPKCSKRLCYVVISEQVVEECFKCSSDASVRVCRIWRQRYPEVRVIIEPLEPCPCEPEPEDSENEVPS